MSAWICHNMQTWQVSIDCFAHRSGKGTNKVKVQRGPGHATNKVKIYSRHSVISTYHRGHTGQSWHCTGTVDLTLCSRCSRSTDRSPCSSCRSWSHGSRLATRRCTRTAWCRRGWAWNWTRKTLQEGPHAPRGRCPWTCSGPWDRILPADRSGSGHGSCVSAESLLHTSHTTRTEPPITIHCLLAIPFWRGSWGIRIPPSIFSLVFLPPPPIL